MRDVYTTEGDISNEDENTTNDEEINEISDHNVHRLIDDLSILYDKLEKLIERTEHMIM